MLIIGSFPSSLFSSPSLGYIQKEEQKWLDMSQKEISHQTFLDSRSCRQGGLIQITWSQPSESTNANNITDRTPSKRTLPTLKKRLVKLGCQTKINPAQQGLCQAFFDRLKKLKLEKTQNSRKKLNNSRKKLKVQAKFVKLNQKMYVFLQNVA